MALLQTPTKDCSIFTASLSITRAHEPCFETYSLFLFCIHGRNTTSMYIQFLIYSITYTSTFMNPAHSYLSPTYILGFINILLHATWLGYFLESLGRGS